MTGHPVAKLSQRLADTIPREHSWTAPPAPSAGLALLAWALRNAVGQAVLLIADGPQSLAALHRDAATLAPRADAPLLLYPPAEDLPARRSPEPDPDVLGQRLAALLCLAAPPPSPAPAVIATAAQALLEPGPDPGRLHAATLRLRRGAEQDRDAVIAHTRASGYRFVPAVSEKGEAAVRGGLLDIWPLTEPWPLRVEFGDTRIESLRRFDPAPQTSVEQRDAAAVPPVALPPAPAGAGGLAACLPPGAVVIWCDADAIAEHAERFAALAAEDGHGGTCLTLAQLRARLETPGSGPHISFRLQPGSAAPLPVALRSAAAVFSIPSGVLPPDRREQVRRAILDDLAARTRRGVHVSLYLDTPGARDRFRETYPAAAAALDLRVGPLSDGVVIDEAGLVILSHGDLYGHRRETGLLYRAPARRAPARRGALEQVADLSAIEPGDYVVHVRHGIGRYLGVHTLEHDGRPREVLSIEYAGGARLHIPVTHVHLLSRYVGLSRRPPALHRLGGKRWQREKDAAQRAVMDLAASLLDTQAERRVRRGMASPPDSPWQYEFEAAFPFRETPDQQEALHAVKADMASPRPMDRLICGDAGYGKTEVAMRAAFQAVMAGRQVAVLVPTTVLAQQHRDTFTERMAAYPVRIEMLSRFCPPARRREVLAGLADGTVDIVVGTHALLQPSVRFRKLGLAVIDEEQRFGVLHKEQFKHLRRCVDVLTLTATPIPRTL
ncbi:MAG: DEAD/DEAH box helicase, partial [Lentisphaerae bacterium]|nr:DEAD/DEAH box helicase [Lentisphaerota bacterium]